MNTDRLQQLLDMLAESPEEAFLQFAIAKEHEKYGRLTESLSWFERLRAQSPGYVATYYHLGKLYEKLDRAADAFRTYSAGIEMARKAGEQHALSELAGARLALGDEEDFED